MAIRFDAASDYLYRTASAPGDPRSVSFWVYLTTDRNAYGSMVIIVNAGGTAFDMVYVGSDGTTLTLSASGSTVSGTNLSTGTWYHIAYTRSGTTRKVYLNGVLDITNTNSNTFTASQFYVGSDSVGYINGRMAYLKMWSAELTADEALAEMSAIRPVRLDNLWAWYPMWPGAAERNLDYSGNGRNLTDNAGVADEDPPPVSYGSQAWMVPGGSAADGTATPAVAAATWAALTASATGAASVTAGVPGASWAAQNADGQGAGTASAGLLTGTWATLSASATGTAQASPSLTTATWAAPISEAIGNGQADATVGTATWATQSATAQGAGQAAPDLLTATWAALSANATGAANVTAGLPGAIWAAYDATASAGVNGTATPDVASATWTAQAPSAQGAGTASAGLLNAAWAAYDATASAATDGTATPDVANANWAALAPGAQGDGRAEAGLMALGWSVLDLAGEAHAANFGRINKKNYRAWRR